MRPLPVPASCAPPTLPETDGLPTRRGRGSAPFGMKSRGDVIINVMIGLVETVENRPP